MARKAELDILEEDLQKAGTAAEEAPEPPGQRPPGFQEHGRSLWSYLHRFARHYPLQRQEAALAWVKSHKLVAFPALGVSLVLLLGLALWLALKSPPATVADKAAPAAVPAAADSALAVSDFTIDLRDAQGNIRFLLCDVVLEFHRGMELTEEKKVDIRRTIYAAAKRKSPDLMTSAQAHALFKREVSTELTRRLGKERVKGVYVTKFVLL